MKPDRKISAVIAEDEYIIAQDIQNAAIQAGYEVVGIAPDGAVALELVREHAPSVVILDVKMPRVDGIEAARRIRDEHPTPVVIMTAYESKEFLDAAKEAGVGAYLVKPPDVASLRRAVELAVARHEDMMELRRANAELTAAMARISSLEGILPICAACKRIMDENGEWKPVEVYIARHSKAEFSHGCCPTCLKKLYPEYADG